MTNAMKALTATTTTTRTTKSATLRTAHKLKPDAHQPRDRHVDEIDQW